VSGDNQPGDQVSVTAVAGGTCVLTFSDPGNANYAQASPVTMSFNVESPHAVALSISATPSTTASDHTNDMVTVTLLDQNGQPTASNGTTVVSLSQTVSPGQNGSGFFADKVNSAANETSVTFAPNQKVAYAYFGDTKTESVSVTASMTGLQSATTSIQVTPGAASQVIVTAAPLVTPASSTSNVGVTISLEDQFKNVVTPSSPTPVTLTSTLSSDGSTSGYFTSLPSSSVPITNDTFTMPSGAALATVYFGDTVATSPGVSVQLGASVAGLSAMTTVGVTAGPPAKVVMNWSSTTIASSNITNTGFSVFLEDAYGNVTAPTNSNTYSYQLSTNASQNHAVFSNVSNDQRGWPGTAQKTWNITLSSSQSVQQLYFGDNQRNVTPTVYVRPTDSGTFTASQQIIVH
jgi:hypothetical protein